MSKRKEAQPVLPPTVVAKLTSDGLKIELQNWAHNAPVRQLDGLEIMVQRVIHQWRAKYTLADIQFNTPSARQRELAEERAANERSST